MITCEECGLVVTDPRILQVVCSICGYRSHTQEVFEGERQLLDDMQRDIQAGSGKERRFNRMD